MAEDNWLQTELRSSEQRYSRLLERRRTEGHGPAVTEAALQELSTALEELRVAEEDLRIQNSVLLEANIEFVRERALYADLFESLPVGYVLTSANSSAAAAAKGSLSKPTSRTRLHSEPTPDACGRFSSTCCGMRSSSPNAVASRYASAAPTRPCSSR